MYRHPSILASAASIGLTGCNQPAISMHDLSSVHRSHRYPGASFLTTSDHLSNTTADDGLEVRADSAYNIGYLFFRPSALPLVDAWLAKVLSDPTGSWDQVMAVVGH